MEEQNTQEQLPQVEHTIEAKATKQRRPIKQRSTRGARKTTTKEVVKIRRPQHGSITETVLTLATTTPNTQAEIAEIANTSTAHVTQILNRYGIDRNALDSYKKHRADILAGKQEQILNSITEDDIKGMPVGQRVMSYGILYDKERLERGESTANVDHIHADIAALKALKLRVSTNQDGQNNVHNVTDNNQVVDSNV